MKEKLGFEIETKPLMYSGSSFGKDTLTDHNFKVIIRDDNSKVLSVMKKTYDELPNRQFEDIVRNIITLSNFKLIGFSEFKEGRVVLANLRNTSGDIVLFKKKIEDYLIVGSSHDGSYPFFIGTAMVNIWCENQFSKLTKITKIRHTSTAKQKRAEMQGLLNLYFKQRELIYKNFEKFQKVEIPEKLRLEVLGRILDIKKEDVLEEKVKGKKLTQFLTLQKDFSIEAAEYGYTAYALFNAATRYTTHDLNSKDKVFGMFHGVPGWINSKAYSIASHLVESKL
jgi:hypothetical protein